MLRQPPSTRFVFLIRFALVLFVAVMALVEVTYNRSQATAQRQMPRATPDGPDTTQQPVPHEIGNAAAGRDVFRFETFGNEGFWTDAVRLPKGIKKAKLNAKVEELAMTKQSTLSPNLVTGEKAKYEETDTDRDETNAGRPASDATGINPRGERAN